MAKTKKEKWSLRQDFRKRWQLYLMLLLPVLYILIFCYVPMGGIIISFKDYSFRKGILGSPWVGLKYFKQFFGSPDIGMLLKNTLIISFYQLIVTFPAPIILALLFTIFSGTISGFRYRLILGFSIPILYTAGALLNLSAGNSQSLSRRQK